jgi:hypothetical protein
VLLLADVAAAAPKPTPKQCGVSITPSAATTKTTTFAGTVKSITASSKDVPGQYAIVVNDGTTDQPFKLYIMPAPPPFKVGDKIDVSLRRGGGWHQVYDGVIKDAAGKILLITSGSGADDWADGWKVVTGKVVESTQNPNSKEKSENRTHALDFTRGKTKVTVLPNKCALLQDGTDRYIVAGSGNSWIGLRPPEGVDYQTFSMMRWP